MTSPETTENGLFEGLFVRAEGMTLTARPGGWTLAVSLKPA